jgi:hypothetical protein
MAHIKIPKLIVPVTAVPVGQARPLQVCPECWHVLSNAGNCENILCSRPDLSSGSVADTSTELKYYSNCSFCSGKRCMGH